MITKHEKIGKIRKAYQKGPLTESFKMMDDDMVLKATIFFQDIVILDDPIFGCYVYFEIYKKSGNTLSEEPIITTTGNAPRTDEISPSANPDIALRLFSLSGSRNSGFRLNFDQVEIQSIQFSEGERLLAFFKNMYGVNITYQADIFGFLEKNGKDEKLKFPLPYPEFILD